MIAVKQTIDAARQPSDQNLHIRALTLWLFTVVVFWHPLVGLAKLSFQDENSSHVLLIPLVSGILLFLRRKKIFADAAFTPALGGPPLLIALVLRYGLAGALGTLNNTDSLAVFTSLIVLSWIAVFLLCYGAAPLKAAVFPLFYLVLMVPLPVAALQDLISLLQKGSADTCNVLFRLLGVPVLRHGFQFSLPTIDIEVARQCSGIHSGLSLIIVGLLAGHLVLPGTWRKVFFASCILPIAIFKNAVRIVTISWFGIYVDRGFLYGRLHREGGLPFSLVALALIAIVLWLLRRPWPRIAHGSRVRGQAAEA